MVFRFDEANLLLICLFVVFMVFGKKFLSYNPIFL